jgi:hypothetical protein
MKLAEALILRAEANKQLNQLRERFARAAKVQEGERPPEDPNALLAEFQQTADMLVRLMKQINRTNSVTAFDADRTLTDALADRDGLALRRMAIDWMIKAAAPPDFRYGRAEIKYMTTVDVGALQRQLDDLARQYRELDTAIQQMNWQVDLIE